MLDLNADYWVYLRKSREDRDAEQRGEGETLTRHENQLKRLSQQLGITVSRTYREVVSGETIAARPEMLRMLSDIEDEMPGGILVVEIERLARGDTRDQGLVLETFKYAGTKIITPMKTYDPNNESDEEYAEFGLFMSRREYKTINRRLQNGRNASINEGKWIGNKAPYGYERAKIPHDKGFTLRPLEEEAKIVQFIFKLFTLGTPESDNVPLGTTHTAKLLDDLGIKPRFTQYWEASVIRGILRNYAYIGKLQVGKRKQVKKIVNGKVQITRPINSNYKIVNALHPAIVDDETFFKAQKILDANYKPPFFKTIKAPLAGLVYCGVCGKSMYRRPAGAKQPKDTVLCKTHNCPTVGSMYDLIENRLLEYLDKYLQDYKIKVKNDDSTDWIKVIENKESALERQKKDITVLTEQINNVYDYFEQKVYTLEMFQKRISEINEKMNTNKKQIEQTEHEIISLRSRMKQKGDFIPFFERILASYYETDEPARKNALLKQIVDHVIYTKTTKGTRLGKGNDAFTLDVFLKLPYQDF